jgi:hypothetical protein
MVPGAVLGICLPLCIPVAPCEKMPEKPTQRHKDTEKEEWDQRMKRMDTNNHLLFVESARVPPMILSRERERRGAWIRFKNPFAELPRDISGGGGKAAGFETRGSSPPKAPAYSRLSRR